MTERQKGGAKAPPQPSPRAGLEEQLRALVKEARRESDISAEIVHGWFAARRCRAPSLAACENIADQIACIQHPHGAPWIIREHGESVDVNPKRFADSFAYLQKSLPELERFFRDIFPSEEHRSMVRQLHAAMQAAAPLASDLRPAPTHKDNRWHLPALTLFRDIEVAMQEAGNDVSLNRNSTAIAICQTALKAAGCGTQTTSAISQHILRWREKYGSPNDHKID